MKANTISALLLAAGLILSANTAVATEPGKESPGELAREGIELLVKALEELIQTIPQYEPPVILDNGDILIRRKWPPGTGPDDETYDDTRA